MKIFTFLCILTANTISAEPPRLTIILIVDQFSHNLMQKVKPYLRHGLLDIIEKGINYTNAYLPHAVPTTGTGHTGLNTGTYAVDHGIIGNKWPKSDGTFIYCDDDSVENAAVFSPTGTYNYGKSPHFIMVDGISDQFVLHSQPENPHYTFALSIKSRSAICAAGKLGKAVWFDNKTGLFTSSKAYFKQLPAWVKEFNDEKEIDSLDSVFWKLAKPRVKRAYKFTLQDYRFVESKTGMIGKKIAIEREKNPNNPYHLFLKTPHANKLLLDLAQSCITEYVNKRNGGHLLLWISLSALDKVGHKYGPESKEVIDAIYHLDKQLERFIRFAHKTAGKQETLFVITTDHGIAPIPERINEKGIPAFRIKINDFFEQANNYFKEKYDIDDAIKAFNDVQLYLNKEPFSSFGKRKYKRIINNFISFLEKQPGIKRAWTNKKLKRATFKQNDIEYYFKKQHYPGRSGSIFIQVEPYTQITKYSTGTNHEAPYEYNTHVPLILYQHSEIELKMVRDKVWTLQLANTLAEILQIPKPTSSTFEILPHVFGSPAL